ncbi:MAG: hypothetical protein JNJ92_10605 [Altererythrobacter sp.]|nr:hypothetical protein [Altererythrobacter sp.]
MGEFSRAGYQEMLSQIGQTVTRPCYGGKHLQFGRFVVPMSEAMVLSIFRQKRDQVTVENAGRMFKYAGDSAKDGSESYALKRVELLFEESSREISVRNASPRPMNFAMYFDIELGDPFEDTFICSTPVSKSDCRYWGSLHVVWSAVWQFFVAPTREFADALRETVLENHGFDVGTPPYYVIDRHA